MSNKFDQLAKGVAQSVTRRQALKRFGGGLAGMALAGFAMSSMAAKCNPSGEFCGRGVPGDNCNKCCSGSHFCEISADLGKQCFCN